MSVMYRRNDPLSNTKRNQTMKTKARAKRTAGAGSGSGEGVIAGKWRAKARFASDGRKNLTPRRFVHNRGVVRIEDAALERKIIDYLKSGYEVRLFNGSVRLYHCVDKEFRTMYIAAATLADSRVRGCVNDVEFDFVRKDGKHDVQDVIDLELDHRQAKDEMVHVSPDTVVECPKCGFQFRVGKTLN